MKRVVPAALLLIIVLGLVVPGLAWGKQASRNITTVTEDIVVQPGEKIIGNITTVSGNIIVFGEVVGNITTAAGNIELKNSSVVRGNITSGTGTIVRQPGADVAGTVFRGANRHRFADRFNYSGPPVFDYSAHVLKRFTNMLGILAVFAILISLRPRNVQTMLGALKMEIGRVILVGILGWVLLPFMIIISLITIVGPFLLLAAALAVFLTGTGILGLLIGEKLVTLLRQPSNNRILQAALGLAALWAASLLPFAAPLVFVASAISGMGVILVTRFGTNRPWFQPRKTGGVLPEIKTEDDEKGDMEDENTPKN